MPISPNTIKNDTLIHLQPILDELIAFEEMVDRTSSDAIPIVETLYERVVIALSICVRLHVPLRRQSFYKFWWCPELD